MKFASSTPRQAHPCRWAGPGSANALTNDALDPVSRMPEFKLCAVSVERASHDGEAVR